MEKTTPSMVKHIIVCGQQRPPHHPKPACGQTGQLIREQLKQRVDELELGDRIRVTLTGCQSPCEEGPNVMVYPENIWYKKVTEDDVAEIIRTEIEPHHNDGT